MDGNQQECDLLAHRGGRAMLLQPPPGDDRGQEGQAAQAADGAGGRAGTGGQSGRSRLCGHRPGCRLPRLRQACRGRHGRLRGILQGEAKPEGRRGRGLRWRRDRAGKRPQDCAGVQACAGSRELGAGAKPAGRTRQQGQRQDGPSGSQPRPGHGPRPLVVPGVQAAHVPRPAVQLHGRRDCVCRCADGTGRLEETVYGEEG